MRIDCGKLRKTIKQMCFLLFLLFCFVLTPNALKRFRRGCGSCLLRNTSDLGLGGFLGRITTREWYFISSLISSSSSLLSEETDNWRCTRSWWSVLSVLRQSVSARERGRESEIMSKRVRDVKGKAWKMCNLMSCTSASTQRDYLKLNWWPLPDPTIPPSFPFANENKAKADKWPAEKLLKLKRLLWVPLSAVTTWQTRPGQKGFSFSALLCLDFA